MPTGEDHYAKFLAPHYTWMGGGLAAQVARNREQLSGLGLVAAGHSQALDLGCGSGYQSLALAELGYDVVAVDSSRTLLRELENSSSTLRIHTLLGDLFDPQTYAKHGPFDAVTCMGDSLLHASSQTAVAELFRQVHAALTPGGRFVISFRDLSQELEGIDRLIPVRMDKDRLMATFLEYTENHVQVHDMIFSKESGGWSLAKSAYNKLRLSAAVARSLLSDAGLTLLSASSEQGFVTLCSQKEVNAGCEPGTRQSQ